MSKQKLLAIDWPPSFARRVRQAAAESGLEVRIAESPQEFMALYPHYQPDIVAFQVFMMEVDGIELVQWLGAQERKASVLLSADHEPRYAEAAKAIAETVGTVEVTVVPNALDQRQFRATLASLAQAARHGGEAKGRVCE
ncbi:MAG: response regulator [Kiloniellales bacterium]|nr:response regulator [Kiloniellales bacterium]